MEGCTSIANVRGVRVNQVNAHLALHTGTVHTVKVRTYVRMYVSTCQQSQMSQRFLNNLAMNVYV